jgi:hypothetical protein
MAREGGCEWYQSIGLKFLYISADSKKFFKGPRPFKKQKNMTRDLKQIFEKIFPNGIFPPKFFAKYICVRQEQMRAVIWEIGWNCAESWINFAKTERVKWFSWVRSHAPSIQSHRGTKVVWPDFQPMRVPEEPVCIDIFRQNPVFTSLRLKSPVHVHRLWTFWRNLKCVDGPRLLMQNNLLWNSSEKTKCSLHFAKACLFQPRVHSHASSIRSHRGKKVVWPDFQPMRVAEEPVCVHLFRQKLVFTSLHLKSPVHVHRLWAGGGVDSTL